MDAVIDVASVVESSCGAAVGDKCCCGFRVFGDAEDFAETGCGPGPNARGVTGEKALSDDGASVGCCCW